MKYTLILTFLLLTSQNLMASAPLNSVQDKVVNAKDRDASVKAEVTEAFVNLEDTAEDVLDTPTASSENDAAVTAAVVAAATGDSQKSLNTELLGFQGWKALQVNVAKEKLESLKKTMDIAPLKGEEPTPLAELKKKEDLEAQGERLKQLEFNLEIAQSLTIHDYFSLYLKTKSKEEINLVVQKLSPAELAELLVSYRDRLDGPIPRQKSSEKNLRENL